MRTSKLLSPLLLSLAASSPILLASETEAVFVAEQGKLILPHLNLGGEIYYVHLERINPQAFDFRLVPSSVTKITPQEGDAWADTMDLIGDWSPEDEPEVVLSIEADGTYSLDQRGDPECTDGVETGQWFYDEETGVFASRTLTDANGDCGLSHPEGAARIESTASGGLLLLINENDGVFEIPLMRR